MMMVSGRLTIVIIISVLKIAEKSSSYWMEVVLMTALYWNLCVAF